MTSPDGERYGPFIQSVQKLSTLSGIPARREVVTCERRATGTDRLTRPLTSEMETAMQNSGRSFWVETANVQHFPQLTGNVEVDVAIIGGGLVGVTTARFLKDAGLKVAVLEARRVGQQVTGKSTAK